MILVTGGTGTTGYFVIRELLSRSLNVRVLVRPSSVNKLDGLNVDIALGDLADVDSLKKAVDGVDGIVHTACTFTDSRVDQVGLTALLDSWQDGPFVLVSSVDVYGAPEYLPLDEKHPLNSTGTDYGRNKVQCEAILKNKVEQTGRTDWSIVRPPQIWGPHPSCAEKIVRHYKQIWEGQAINLAVPDEENSPVPGDGWIDARELAWIAAECLEKPLNKAVNVFNSHFTWKELYQELIKLTGSVSPIEPKPSSEVYGIYAHAWQYNKDLLNENLDFRPTYDWRETLSEIVLISKSTLSLHSDLSHPPVVNSDQKVSGKQKPAQKFFFGEKFWDKKMLGHSGT